MSTHWFIAAWLSVAFYIVYSVTFWTSRLKLYRCTYFVDFEWKLQIHKVYTYTIIHWHTCTDMLTYIHSNKHTYTVTHLLYTYTHTYMYIHTCVDNVDTTCTFFKVFRKNNKCIITCTCIYCMTAFACYIYMYVK